MAAIIPFNRLAWEQLFWFLKYLIPKLTLADPDADTLDELLESVDLSTYGLERVKLNHAITLDDSDPALDPQNPNPRGAYGSDPETDPLDNIVRMFNERWFQGWGATPEEQKVKFVNITDNIKSHPGFAAKYQNNTDPHTRSLAFEKMLKEVMLKRRKEELELYKLFAGDPAFKASLTESLERAVEA